MTGTDLNDGRVLVCGGLDSAEGLILASCELYDPKTGAFSHTGSMTTPRDGQTATLLSDGRVLVAGGFNDAGNPLSSAELYDPLEGKFVATGSMKTARAEQSASRLADGRVLIVGGLKVGVRPEASDFYSTAEIFDPRSGRFSPAGTMGDGRAQQSQITLRDGRVLVVGGWGGENAPDGLTWAEVFDPSSGTFAEYGPTVWSRTLPTLAMLPNGRVLIAGGSNVYGSSQPVVAEVFDPSINGFLVAGNLLSPSPASSAAQLPDGSVLLAGDPAEIYWP